VYIDNPIAKMADLIRDAPVGQLLRYITRNKVLLYPEEKPGFQCPSCYSEPDAAEKRLQAAMRSTSSTSMEKSAEEQVDAEKVALEPAEPTEPAEQPEDLNRVETEDLERMETAKDLEKSHTLKSTMSRVNTKSALEKAVTRAELEEAFRAATQDLSKEPSRPIIPERTADGTILVDWYTTDDPENPQNWSQGKKAATALQICLYTLAFYMGSAIYTPSAPYLEKIYGVGLEVTSLGLSLYVLAYGLGPLLFSPLSEIPSIGRNPPYIFSFGIFVILCIPTALVDNIPGLLVLRFLQGFFGSPCLATGGASLQDIYSLIKLVRIIHEIHTVLGLRRFILALNIR
jgi:MFS transporter, DHA1 family, multidrug resistance protein